jgi:hypothetical protein
VDDSGQNIVLPICDGMTAEETWFRIYDTEMTRDGILVLSINDRLNPKDKLFVIKI